MGRVRRQLALHLALVLLGAGASHAQPTLPGDLNGDGTVGSADYGLFGSVYGTQLGEACYDPAGDLDADGSIGAPDLAVLGRSFGSSGTPDTAPPTLFVTLNDIPDDMNDLLVVPPDGFHITLTIDDAAGSLIDMASLSVTSSQDLGPHPAGTNLVPAFDFVSPTRAVLAVPAGSELERSTHTLTVSVSDVAGNAAQAVYGFAVRDFGFGAPLGNLQTVFLDFDQDRSLGPEIDFLEDLRSYGLSSSQAPALETLARDFVVDAIVERVCLLYGRDAACQAPPGGDPVNIVFQSTPPAAPHTRICVGGQSAQGAAFLGAATLDTNNVVEASDECATAQIFGVFPQAIHTLWGSAPGYQSAFGPLRPDLGGTPFGEHPLDAWLADPAFDIAKASPAQLMRAFDLFDAVDAFVEIVAVATAHEVGHTLGLVAHGPAPGGLWGGTSGGATDHNVAPQGGVPEPNYLMNPGASFSFDEITGRGGLPSPVFRPLSHAYLRDRVVLDDQVTALLPAPTLDSVTPSQVVYTASSPENAPVTLHGSGFSGSPAVELWLGEDALPVFGVTLVDDETITVLVSRYFVVPGVYDVRLVNGDGQEVTLPAGLEILFE